MFPSILYICVAHGEKILNTYKEAMNRNIHIRKCVKLYSSKETQ